MRGKCKRGFRAEKAKPVRRARKCEGANRQVYIRAFRVATIDPRLVTTSQAKRSTLR